MSNELLADIEKVKIAVEKGEIKPRVAHIRKYLGCDLGRAMEIFDVLNPDIAERVNKI